MHIIYNNIQYTFLSPIGNIKTAMRNWKVAIPSPRLVNPLHRKSGNFLPFRPFLVLLMHSNSRTSLDTSFYYTDGILLYNYYKLNDYHYHYHYYYNCIYNKVLNCDWFSVYFSLYPIFFFVSFLLSFLCCENVFRIMF